MRILLVHPGPSFSVSDVFDGWREALADLGQHVATFNMGSRLSFYEKALFKISPDEYRRALTVDQAIGLAANGLLSAAYQVLPDMILIVSAFYTPSAMLGLLRTRGHRVVLACTEQPYELPRELELAAHADLTLINDPTNLDAFRKVGAAEYMPQCYRPSIHHPGPPDPDLAADLAFVGTGFPSRIEFLEAMDLAGLDVLLAGQWQLLTDASPLRKHLAHDVSACLDNTRTAAVYRSARAGLNLYRREADRPELSAGYAMGPREVEMAACGLFFLRDPRPEGDELFPMLPTFTDPADATAKLRWYLDRDDLRADLAGKARAAVADRTFTNQAKSLLRLLDA